MEKLEFTPGTAEPSFDPQRRVDMLNLLPGNLPGEECPRCRNKGFVAYLVDGEYLTVTDCQCANVRKQQQRLERSGLGRVIRGKTFDSFRASEPWQQKLKAGVWEYAQRGEGWLLLCGQSGGGKTHLCSAVCRELILRGMDVRYVSWRDEAARIKADPAGREAVLEPLRTAQVLYLDDLFKAGKNAEGLCVPSAADVGIAFDILNYRYNNDLITVISTELLLPELDQVDSALTGRIQEMAGRHVYTIRHDPARDHRRHSRSAALS